VTITGTGNYTGTKTQTFTIVAKAASTLTIDEIANLTYTGSTLTPVPVVRDGNTLLILGRDYTITSINSVNAGTARLSVTAIGNYTGIRDINFTIDRAPLTITAQNKTKVYGASNPTLTLGYTGLVNGDTKVSTEPSIATTATESSVVGTYAITLTGGSDVNYTITRVSGEMAVTKAPLTITAQDKTKVYGAANPALTFAYTGLVNGDTKAATEPTIATTATAASNVGSFPITLTGGLDANYDLTLVAGDLAVTKASLTVTAQNKAKVYGEANPTLTFAYTGLVNGDAKVSTEPIIATTATASSAVGTYPITLSGGTDANYEITNVAGEMAVTKASLTITAQNKTKVYGEANPTLTFAYTGLVNGDAKVSTEPSIATTATASSVVGNYPITLTGGSDANYEITRVAGEMAVTKASLTITAQNKTKVYGDANPTLTFAYTGLVNGDSKVSTEPSIATTATASSSVGTYPITLTGGSDANYDLTLVVGQLAVTKAPLTITAQNKTKIFGRVDPLLTYLVAGLKGLDAEDKVISGTLVRVSGEEPGLYGINQGSVSANSNYEIVFVSGKLEIIPARMLSVVALGTVQTAWGTSPTLPTKATVLTTDGQSFDVGVTWNTANLNVLARGLYVIPGAFDLPKGIENPDKLSISQSVRVLPKPAPRDVTINNNSFEASTTTFFIPIGAFLVNDPIDKIHVVSLFGTGYDNKYFEIKDNILFWSSKEPAAGKTNFSIVVRVRDRDGNTIEKFFEIRRSRPNVSSVTVYSAFSPNGDRINDTWGVPEVRFYQGVRIMVFEKDGKPLFSTENPDTRWDGTFNGKELAVGTYFWVIQIKETGEMRRGMLNLIRK
jgi:gliding motility-associated-like protein